jgi:hypothetical protein
MLPNEQPNRMKQFLRATFPYLVFSTIFLLGMLVIMVWAFGEETTPAHGSAILERAHSHNDYERTRPLLDALDLGFCSVEADIYLVDGALLVAHDRDKVSPERTLDALYLKPLWERFEANNGHIHAEPAPFTLLIDIKNNGAETFRALDRQLAAYAPMLSEFTSNSTKPGAVTVIISGDRAKDVILASNPRRAGIDGRLADLDGPLNPHEMPLISDNWFAHFKWLGTGEMPPDEAVKLAATIEKAHKSGIRIRFWAIPQTAAVWRRLYDAGVDLLNADNLADLRAVLAESPPPAP